MQDKCQKNKNISRLIEDFIAYFHFQAAAHLPIHTNQLMLVSAVSHDELQALCECMLPSLLRSKSTQIFAQSLAMGITVQIVEVFPVAYWYPFLISERNLGALLKARLPKT